MKSSALPYWLTLMVLFLAGYGAFKWRQVARYEAERAAGGVSTDIEPRMEEFELTERSGQPFRSRDMLGKVWVTTFFFTTCPGSCTRLNGNIASLNKLDELRDVTWVSITVDPVNDTLEVLRDYADRHGADPARWLFCRGELAYVSRIATEYLQLGIVYYKGHKDYAVVIDRTGTIRGMFDATSQSQTERLRLLLLDCLAEPAPKTEPNQRPAKPVASATAETRAEGDAA